MGCRVYTLETSESGEKHFSSKAGDLAFEGMNGISRTDYERSLKNDKDSRTEANSKFIKADILPSLSFDQPTDRLDQTKTSESYIAKFASIPIKDLNTTYDKDSKSPGMVRSK